MIVVPTTRDDLEGLLLLQIFNLDFPSGWCYVVTWKAVSLKQELNSGSRLLSHTGNCCFRLCNRKQLRASSTNVSFYYSHNSAQRQDREERLGRGKLLFKM